MDKASASGAGDSRFESWAGHLVIKFKPNRSPSLHAAGVLEKKKMKKSGRRPWEDSSLQSPFQTSAQRAQLLLEMMPHPLGHRVSGKRAVL
jgi:hypothetical protein